MKDQKAGLRRLLNIRKRVQEEFLILHLVIYQTIGKINDLAVTNNGDSRKVLATVASTLYAFMEKHLRAWVAATGNTSVRTRLYRMSIANNLEEISKDFMVLQWMGFGRISCLQRLLRQFC